MQLTDVYLWNDPGFTEGSVEYPAIDSLGVLPTPTISRTSQTFYQSKDTIFSELKMMISYQLVMKASYMRLRYVYSDGIPLYIYAWIDNIEMLSDQSSNELCRITFHIDYWRSYAGNATYNYGVVKRRPRGTADPIQQCPYRYRTPSDFQAMRYTGKGKDLLWMYLTYTNETSDQYGNKSVTDIRTAVIPLRTDDIDDHTYYSLDSGTTIHKSIPFSHVVYNTFDEKLGISPSTITSVYISRYPPFEIDQDGGNGDDNDAQSCLWIKSQASEPERTTYNDTSKATSHWWAYNKSTHQGVTTYYAHVNYTNGSSESITIPSAGLTGKRVLGTMDNFAYYQFNGGSVVQGYIYMNTIDNYIKEIIGDDKWSTLRTNDTITFANAENFCTDYSMTITPSDDTMTAVITATGTSQLQTFTYNGSSFGSQYIILNSRQSPVFTLAHQISADTGDIAIGYNGSSETDNNSYLYTKSSYYYAHSLSLSNELSTTDTIEYAITDLNGQVVGSLPWGIKCKDYTVRPIVTSTGGYTEFRFGGIDSHSQGTCYTIPMMQVDLSSNSWSDYVYSGQRDYDIEQRRIANEQALISGITGALSGGISSGIMASLGTTKGTKMQYLIPDDTGGYSGYSRETFARAVPDEAGYYYLPATKRKGMGGLLGGALQAGAGVIGAGLEYGINLAYNDRLQSAEDTLQAKQLDNITAYGNGWDWLHYGRYPGIISLSPDEYSLDQFNNQIQYNGIECNEIMSSCDSLIKGATGPLQVTDLIIGGSIPIQAKQAIKTILGNGIRLIHTESST